jgi:hypothetical protein
MMVELHWCGSGGSIYFKDISQNTLSAYTHNDTSIKVLQAGVKLSKPQISQQHPSRICFITPDWHGTVTRDLDLSSLKMGIQAHSIVSSNKFVFKTIMALKLNQIQVTFHKIQVNSIIERIQKVVVCQ